MVYLSTQINSQDITNKLLRLSAHPKPLAKLYKARAYKRQLNVMKSEGFLRVKYVAPVCICMYVCMYVNVYVIGHSP